MSRPPVSRFWSDKEAWPFDNRENVFFGRAIDLIGSAMFADWQGLEFGVTEPEALPPFVEQPHGVRFALHHVQQIAALLSLPLSDPALLLLQYEGIMPRAAPKPPPPSILSRSFSHGPIPKERSTMPLPAVLAREQGMSARKLYDQATARLEEARAVTEPYVKRARAVERAISEACVRGDLITAYLWQDGRYYLCTHDASDPGGWWNVGFEKRISRFTTCLIDRLNPIQLAGPKATTDPCWLFVGREGLERYLSTVRPVRLTGEPAGVLAARRHLEQMCREHYDQRAGPVPVAAHWRADAPDRFGITRADAKRVWERAAVQYPGLKEKAGKPKRRSRPH